MVDFITVNADIITSGGNGSVTLNAADSVIQNANITTSGSGVVTLNAEGGNVTMAPGTTTTVEEGKDTHCSRIPDKEV